MLDGLVLARSAFHHSMNYRSVVLYGMAEVVTVGAEKRLALDAIVERVAPGRAAAARPPTDAEFRATVVLALPLVEVSAKVRTGGPIDDEADLDWPVWAGVIPSRLVAGDGGSRASGLSGRPGRGRRDDRDVVRPEHRRWTGAGTTCMTRSGDQRTSHREGQSVPRIGPRRPGRGLSRRPSPRPAWWPRCSGGNARWATGWRPPRPDGSRPS